MIIFKNIVLDGGDIALENDENETIQQDGGIIE